LTRDWIRTRQSHRSLEQTKRRDALYFSPGQGEEAKIWLRMGLLAKGTKVIPVRASDEMQQRGHGLRAQLPPIETPSETLLGTTVERSPPAPRRKRGKSPLPTPPTTSEGVAPEVCTFAIRPGRVSDVGRRR
jgi:hypothetical protein